MGGTFTALVTPFRQGTLDETAFAHLVEEQIAAGIDGLIPVGTTGESPTLSMEEHLRVIELTAEVAKGRVRVFAGTGSNSTAEALHLSQEAEKRGADGLLVVCPYYNKPTQAGLLAHYGALAAATRLPILTYSIPSRCGIEIAVETMAELARRHPSIVGIKESGGSIERFSQLRAALPADCAIFSGDDSMTLPAMAVGAVGVVSVASNLIPNEVIALVTAIRHGRADEAEFMHRRLLPLFRDLFIESNPVPVKMALARRGWMTEDVRLPLVPLSSPSRAKLDALLPTYGL